MKYYWTTKNGTKIDVDDMSTPSPSSGHPILTGVQFSTVAALYLYFFLGAYPFMWGYQKEVNGVKQLQM